MGHAGGGTAAGKQSGQINPVAPLRNRGPYRMAFRAGPPYPRGTQFGLSLWPGFAAENRAFQGALWDWR